MSSTNPCPCGTNKLLSDCCGPLIKGTTVASSPEALMRSRYAAFALKEIEYILSTTDPQARQKYNSDVNRDWAENSVFLNLEIINSSEEGNKGSVEFKATYKTNDGETQTHHELSKFRKHSGVWYFRDGKKPA